MQVWSTALYRPEAARRLAIFITNALSGWHDAGAIKLNFPEMREDFDASQKVKREAKDIVVLRQGQAP
jgi:hypothetical protein